MFGDLSGGSDFSGQGLVEDQPTLLLQTSKGKSEKLGRRLLAVALQAEWCSLVVSWHVRFSVLGEGASAADPAPRGAAEGERVDKCCLALPAGARLLQSLAYNVKNGYFLTKGRLPTSEMLTFYFHCLRSKSGF